MLALVISLVAFFSSSIGYIAANVESNAEDEIMSLLSEIIVNANDLNILLTEPFSSYSFNIGLMDITKFELEDDEIVSMIQKVLISDLENQKDVVIEFCKTRPGERTRKMCAGKVEQAQIYLDEFGTLNNNK